VLFAASCSAAIARKQLWHTQSSKPVPAEGRGWRVVSAAHQHSFERPQENSVPQRAQVTLRLKDNEFVMLAAAKSGWFFSRNSSPTAAL
jgi:hypothetical protein